MAFLKCSAFCNGAYFVYAGYVHLGSLWVCELSRFELEASNILLLHRNIRLQKESGPWTSKRNVICQCQVPAVKFRNAGSWLYAVHIIPYYGYSCWCNLLVYTAEYRKLANLRHSCPERTTSTNHWVTRSTIRPKTPCRAVKSCTV